MNLDKIEKIAYDTMARRKTALTREIGFIYYHGQRTAKMALNLRKAILPENTCDDDLLYVGALFHDVAKGIEPHHEIGAVLVQELLRDCVTSNELTTIAEIVQGHNQRDHTRNYSVPVKLVQDADILDHVGTVQIWLNFLYCAQYERNMAQSLEFWQGREFQGYLAKIRAQLNFQIAQNIFDDRVNFMNRFMERFISEINGELGLAANEFVTARELKPMNESVD